MNNVKQFFSTDYFTARQKFLSATTATSLRSQFTGPQGQPLYTDISYLGPKDADNLMVLVSGTHGVEGYCGSAAQLAFLHSPLADSAKKSIGILLIHALNPYGFAWDRRVTAEGCDLNRNFLDFTQPIPENDEYRQLANYLIPPDISPAGLADAESHIKRFRQQFGEHVFQSARKRGQYTHATGMFYGGRAPSESRQCLEKIVADYQIDARKQVVIIDYHTGLGPYGYGELQCETPSGMKGYQRALKIFGPSVTSPELGTSSSVHIIGTQDEFWQRILGDRHTYVCLEFGTYDQEKSREVLRNDHWLFTYKPEEADSERGRLIRSATRHQYYPELDDWQEMVIFRCNQIHAQAVSSLCLAE
ncbi:DUF2817 domain-containing protein [Klebsiella sp. 2680]|uniref:DUF2817 domain-containing protein n=1 Tax=Klebsiella sp. 2680 TaxID=2018037 RepID=UPI001157E9BB|nr:DUF2817 domain-containing protein [Klebsiella sp. 2680]